MKETLLRHDSATNQKRVMAASYNFALFMYFDTLLNLSNYSKFLFHTLLLRKLLDVFILLF